LQMKAILFLAVLVIAAQSNQLAQLYRGFISNIPMEAELKNSVMNDGLECIHQTEGMLMWVVRIIQKDIISGKNYLEAIKEFLYAEDMLSHHIAPQCLMTYQRIRKFMRENAANVRVDFNDRYEFSLLKAKLVQTFARSIEDMFSGRGFNAGEKLATFYKLGDGLMDPELPKIADLDWDKYVPFNEERFINEFIPSFFRELGASETQINGYVYCVKTLIPVFRKAFSNRALYSGQFLPAVTAFLEGALEIVDALQKCERQVDLVPFQRLFGLFMSHPVKFLVMTNISPLLEFFTITEAQFNLNVHSNQGEYVLAGKDAAKIVKAHFRGIAY